MDWISINTMLPGKPAFVEEEVMLLSPRVRIKGCIDGTDYEGYAQYWVERKMWIAEGNTRIDLWDVTHWQPLPELLEVADDSTNN